MPPKYVLHEAFSACPTGRGPGAVLEQAGEIVFQLVLEDLSALPEI